MKHALNTFHEDVRARFPVTEVAHKGYGVLRGGNVDDRTTG